MCRSVVHKHSENFSTLCQVSRQKLQNELNRWQWACNDERLETNRLTSTSAEHFLRRNALLFDPAAKQLSKRTERDNWFISVDLSVAETVLRRKITLSELEKACSAVETDYAFSTVDNGSEDYSRNALKRISSNLA